MTCQICKDLVNLVTNKHSSFIIENLVKMNIPAVNNMLVDCLLK